MENMRVLANRKIKMLFLQILFCILIFLLCSVPFLFFWERLPVLGRMGILLYMLIYPVGIGGVILAICYRYFREQDRMLEDAVSQIQGFLSGDREARIACDEEGELYRLFHEINSLAAILNAQATKEVSARKFLQNTISDISHQLKTPLAALNIYNGILQTEAETNKLTTIREFTVLSEQELDRMESLTQNLLKITKFDAGSILIEKNIENVSDILADIKAAFSFRAEQEEKEILLSGGESVFLLCDRSWIVEAVSNIVKNALDHTERGNHVWIEWRESAAAVRITIKDDGSGIHPEDLHHIFKRFYRSRYSKDTQGIGLGLPLAKTVIEAHNGTIEVDSRLGEGTVFILNFLQDCSLTEA